MRKGQFNSRTPRNVIRGGSRGDQFNSAHKKERHDEPPQFAASDVEEIRRVSETKDTRPDRSQNKDRDTGSRSSKNGSSGKAARNATNTLVRQAVIMVAGAVVVTNSYQAAVEKRDLERSDAAAVAEDVWLDEQELENVDSEALAEAFWIWAEDYSSATFVIPGVGQADAAITVTEEPAGCTTEGLRTFTASVVVNGTTYTDVVTEVIPATGHSFGEPQTETDADGNITILYHCSGCDQIFEIGFTAEKAEE